MLAPRTRSSLLIGVPVLLAVACGSDAEDAGTGFTGGTGAAAGSSGKGSGGKGSGGTTIVPTTGGSAGHGGSGASGGSIATGGSGGSSSGTSGSGGSSMCASDEYQQKTSSALDIYFVFDRTGSMGTDCAYTPGGQAPVASKACYATYAVSDYLIHASPSADTRLAFQFMSLADDDCDGGPYETPLVPLTALPIASDHALIRAISDETFKGGYGTHIEGALRGIAAFTTAHKTAGREMIGVLMTDGDPNGCLEDVGALGDIIAKHLQDTGIRTFVIGMQGATDQNLESLGRAGGADPHDKYCGSVNAPCHYWNVGSGAGDTIAQALTAIVEQAAPIPCEFPVSGFTPPSGQKLDFGKVNVTLTDNKNTATQIGQVPDAASCPANVPAWYYDNPAAPKAIELCSNACSLVTDAATGSRVNVVVGCQDTVVLPPIK